MGCWDCRCHSMKPLGRFGGSAVWRFGSQAELEFVAYAGAGR
ncbi:hypothetical protein PAMC26577_24530 [Caballeronia sordidicola]|uniref:Uncharacterized protein n=1 Tax=Caballeronia sordidicola TaxID=196367 RepID=A0A242MLK1_CABSO|nr:hypothetical protein PAMC26577_24530 [Caballeronia sordidicola]